MAEKPIAEPTTIKKFKVNDRVRRADGNGCHGIVKEVRLEATTGTTEAREKIAMINVLWDNGTLSYFGASGLEIAKE